MLETRLISRIQHLNARGLSRRSIARRLGVSKNTVKKYLRNPALSLRRDGNGRAILQPCYDYLAKLLLDDPSIPAKIAFREANAKGFHISETSVSAFLSKQRHRDASAQHRRSRIHATMAEILRCMTTGKSYLDALAKYMRGSTDNAPFALTEQERETVIQAGHQGRYRKWRYGVAIDMTGLGISAHEISQLLGISRNTLRRVMIKYRRDGFAGVFQRNSRDVQTEKHRNSQLKAKRILEILHQRPNSFGINRTSWTQPLISEVYERTLTQAKRRPALVVSALEGDDLILCQITSQFVRDNYAVSLNDKDFETGGLKQPTQNLRKVPCPSFFSCFQTISRLCPDTPVLPIFHPSRSNAGALPEKIP